LTLVMPGPLPTSSTLSLFSSRTSATSGLPTARRVAATGSCSCWCMPARISRVVGSSASAAQPLATASRLHSPAKRVPMARSLDFESLMNIVNVSGWSEGLAGNLISVINGDTFRALRRLTRLGAASLAQSQLLELEQLAIDFFHLVLQRLAGIVVSQALFIDTAHRKAQCTHLTGQHEASQELLMYRQHSCARGLGTTRRSGCLLVRGRRVNQRLSRPVSTQRTAERQQP